MFRFTFHIVTALWAASFLFGCSEPGPVACPELLQPGRDMMLESRFEMQDNGVGTCERVQTSSDGETKVVKKEYHPSSGVYWGRTRLPMRVAGVPDSENRRLTMTVERYESGTMSVSGGEKHEEQSGFNAGDPPNPESETEKKFRDTTFLAVVSPERKILELDIDGKGWEDFKNETREKLKDNEAYGKLNMALSLHSLGIFLGLEDALAYWPAAKEFRWGQSWKVRREMVLPYHVYAYYMLTNGCTYAEEESFCTVTNIKTQLEGVMVTIRIRGRRTPHAPEKGMPNRVREFDLEGEMKINATTGAIQELRLESRPHFIAIEDVFMLNLRFLETLSLKPR